MTRYSIDADIALAETLPGSFYHDRDTFEACRERVFARSWQWLGELADVGATLSLSPRTIAPGHLDEPVFLARDGEGVLRCLPNVCTHRGNLLVTKPCSARDIRCAYHSRRFDYSGRMTFMPEFDGAQDFPREADHLKPLAFGQWRDFGFAAIESAPPFDSVFADLRAATDGLWPKGLIADPDSSRDYVVAANWALYVENYLEGFHIPHVHPGLKATVEVSNYRTRCHAWSVRQTAWAKDGETAFAEGDFAGENGRIAADYWWIYPNLMLNFYPWGLSVNVVLPEAIDRTRVRFFCFVADPALRNTGAGSALEQVEMEDEAIVEAVQRGTASRFYGRGRYSPTMETGTHHFHRLLADALT
jgi:choline monooxygenase